MRAEPVPFGLCFESYTCPVEPLVGAVVVVTGDHVPIGHLLAAKFVSDYSFRLWLRFSSVITHQVQ